MIVEYGIGFNSKDGRGGRVMKYICDSCEKYPCSADETKLRLSCPAYSPKPKPLTNADRFRAMSDEELAVVIAWPYLASPPWCSEHTTCPYISEDPTPCDKCALDWLKQEATDNA